MTNTHRGVILAGAPDDTPNLGVTALNRSVLSAIHSHAPDLDITVLDYRDGEGDVTRTIGEERVTWRRRGHRPGHRYWRSDNLTTMRVLGRLGLRLGAARSLADATACLDIGGGDSFADLYGIERFRLVADLRQLVLDLATPLVLLPQTYGPFTAEATRDEARSIVTRSAMAWARDGDSFDALHDLVGDEFDPDRHRQGVDVAFGLPSRRPADHIAVPLEESVTTSTVGVNISGLVYNDPTARDLYGHVLDYRAVATEIVARLLAEDVDRIVLVPHVLSPPESLESDRVACETVRRALGNPERIVIAPDLDADEVKWLIGRLDWFCGTRMHATIAALSSGVPCATVAYSLKARGVFASCGAETGVADARELGDAEAVEVVMTSWKQRDQDRAAIGAAADRLKGVARDQMLEILRWVGVG